MRRPDQAGSDAIEDCGHDAPPPVGKVRCGETAADGIVEGERALDRSGLGALRQPHRRRLAMVGIDAAPVFALENRVNGEESAVLEDADLARMALHLDDALSRGVGHAVEVAADRDHAFVTDAALDSEHRAIGHGGMQDQGGFLLGEVFSDDALRGGVDTLVGDPGPPLLELGVEVVEIAEGAGEEEVLADVAIRSLHLPLGLGPVRPAGPRQRAVMIEQRDKGGVVDDDTIGVLVDDGGLHAIVQHLRRRPVHGGEGVDMAAEYGLQILRGTEPPPRANGSGRAPWRTARQCASRPVHR